MMHAERRDLHGPSSENDVRETVLSSHSALAGEVEVLMAVVSKAKRIADESLARANEAPHPHETSNTIFVALYETHWRDREALFEAMRRLDKAREELRAAEMTAMDKNTSSIARSAI